jgi:hypothetical protein
MPLLASAIKRGVCWLLPMPMPTPPLRLPPPPRPLVIDDEDDDDCVVGGSCFIGLAHLGVVEKYNDNNSQCHLVQKQRTPSSDNYGNSCDDKSKCRNASKHNSCNLPQFQIKSSAVLRAYYIVNIKSKYYAL